jgi:glycine/D-amino acid oxidase-like deaminating enzyme
MTGVGLSCFLRERGLKTVVLKRGTIAGGVTGRNVGFLVSGLGEHYARSIEFWGREPAAALTRLQSPGCT